MGKVKESLDFDYAAPTLSEADVCGLHGAVVLRDLEQILDTMTDVIYMSKYHGRPVTLTDYEDIERSLTNIFKDHI